VIDAHQLDRLATEDAMAVELAAVQIIWRKRA
jgi:hypothetical protein